MIRGCAGLPRMLPRIIFILCLLVSASGFVSPPVALALGLVFGLTLPHPYGRRGEDILQISLQASVVGLGFGMNLHQVVAGRAQRLRLHHAGHQFRAACGHGPGRAVQCATRARISHFHRHGDLRRKRHCRCRAHHAGQRRRDGHRAGNRLRAEFRGAADFSCHWRGA